MKNDKKEKKETLKDKQKKTENQNDKSQEQIKQMEENLEKLENQIQEEKDRYIRLYAEFDNYKKRTAKEKINLIETASEDVIKSLLPVLDDFERALTELKKTENKELYKGVELIYEKLRKTLFDKGLKEIEVKSGDDFNPDFHEAVAQIPGDSKHSGKIHEVIEKGYKLGQKIIRYPKVVTVQ